MSDVTKDRLLETVNRIAPPRWKRLTWLAVLTLGLVGVLSVGAVTGIAVRDWWVLRAQNQTNLNAAVLILDFNLKNGRLTMPPALVPPSPAPPPPPTGPAVPEKKPGG